MAKTEINEEHVREIAYRIWNNEGQPEGKAEEHWHRALSEMQSKDEETAAPDGKAPSLA